jgi:hypothetical protein
MLGVYVKTYVNVNVAREVMSSQQRSLGEQSGIEILWWPKRSKRYAKPQKC